MYVKSIASQLCTTVNRFETSLSVYSINQREKGSSWHFKVAQISHNEMQKKMSCLHNNFTDYEKYCLLRQSLVSSIECHHLLAVIGTHDNGPLE